ncbi:MAG: UDPGP type 1 family protein [Victivallaceae bacterium]|nr:UDPGP type 1 family protein [Victivallaceae bacterium]
MTIQISTLLKQHRQEHVLKFYNELNENSKAKLAEQLKALPWNNLDELISQYVINYPKISIPEDLQPAPFFPTEPDSDATAELYQQARAEGVRLLQNGRVSFLMVAGGQGTRLGFDGPKGTYPITPVKGKSLFQYFSEKIRHFGEKYGVEFTWYIMTSELNHEATTQFFADHEFFGLDQDQIVFFTQGTMPAFDNSGKLLLSAKDSLALSPDGHGGTLLALHRCGCLERMRSEGVEYLSYFQVDNPLVSIADPLFLGLHALEQSEMSAIMLPKTGPFEKLGNFCISGGRLHIIEYSDLPDALAESRNPDGSLRFIAGSPAIHILNRSFVEKLTAGGQLNLPWHRADKKVPFINDCGELVNPETPNAVKLESFIFDALPLASKTMILEAVREEEFAPTKNKTGVDSVESCRMMLIERDALRLERAGVKIARDTDGKAKYPIELSPAVIIDDNDAIEYCKEKQISDLSKTETAIYLG